MKDRRFVMGMPIEIEIADAHATLGALDDAFAFLESVDARYSPYKDDSEVSRLNRGELTEATISGEFRDILERAELMKRATGGSFDVRRPDGRLDPSGLVKGWAIRETAERLARAGFRHFFVNAGGDIAMRGENASGEPWSVGIENPFKREEIVKVVYPRSRGIATSGSYIRGAHIYDPLAPGRALEDIVSITVIGPDVEQADAYATAAFAKGREGIAFIEASPGFEGYMIDAQGTATMTSGFAACTVRP